MALPEEINRRIEKDIAEHRARVEAECQAQLRIIDILGPLSHQQRKRVMIAAKGLIDADEQVSGIIDAFLRGQPESLNV